MDLSEAGRQRKGSGEEWGVGAKTHARAAIGVDVGFDPDDVLAASVAPFCEDFATPLKALAGAAADPHEDKGWVRSKSGDGKFQEFVPAERGGKGRIEENHVEFVRV